MQGTYISLILGVPGLVFSAIAAKIDLELEDVLLPKTT